MKKCQEFNIPTETERQPEEFIQKVILRLGTYSENGDHIVPNNDNQKNGMEDDTVLDVKSDFIDLSVGQ